MLGCDLKEDEDHDQEISSKWRDEQDLVFIVKLQFGKTLVSVQTNLHFKKIFVHKVLDQKQI